SLATPWRGLVNLVDLIGGQGSAAPYVVPVALVLAAGLAAALLRRTASPDVVPAPVTGPGLVPDPVTDAAHAALALTAAWVLLAPYSLPWYDAMVWAPLAVAAPSVL